MALEIAAVKARPAGAIDGEGGIYSAGFERRESHDRLEGRAGRKAGLNGAVQKRILPVLDQRAPVLRTNAAGEHIGVEGRPADHGEHLTRTRIERHYRAVLTFHRQFSDHLKIEIE